MTLLASPLISSSNISTRTESVMIGGSISSNNGTVYHHNNFSPAQSSMINLNNISNSTNMYVSNSILNNISTNSGSALITNNSLRHLLPSIKIKTNELFYKWISQNEKFEQLAEAINFITINNRLPKSCDLKSLKNVYRYIHFVYCYFFLKI